MGSYAKLLAQEKVKGTEFSKSVFQLMHDGSCQCFGDCDCYKDKGKILGKVENFKHPLSDKSFLTLEACTTSYEALIKTLTP